jgi:hypothetical protein
MKKFLLILLTITLLPQVAFAAWWNPLSWKIIKKTDSKTQILENRVKELEQKLEAGSTTNSVKATKENTNSVKNNPVVTPQTASKLSDTSVTQAQKSEDGSYDELISKYSEFRSTIINAKSLTIKNSYLQTERNYYSYLDQLQTRVNSDISYLTSVKYYNPRPSGIVEIYSTKYTQLNDEYRERNRAYATDLREEELQRPAKEKQAEEEIQNKAQEEAGSRASAKAIKLKAVNKKIVDLNSKYAKDMKDCSGRAVSMSIVYACENAIERQYRNDYNILSAEYDAVQYGDE